MTKLVVAVVAKHQVVDDHHSNEAFLFGAEQSQDRHLIRRKHRVFLKFVYIPPRGAQMGMERSDVL